MLSILKKVHPVGTSYLNLNNKFAFTTHIFFSEIENKNALKPHKYLQTKTY